MNRDKKILFISQSFYPAVGGVSTFLVSLIHNLLAYGYEIHVLHFKVSESSEDDNFNQLHPEVIQHEVSRDQFSEATLVGYSTFKEVLYKHLHGLSDNDFEHVDQLDGYLDYQKVVEVFKRKADEIVRKYGIQIINIQDYQMYACLELTHEQVKKIFSLHAPILENLNTGTKEWLRGISNNSNAVIVSTPQYKKAGVNMGVFEEAKIFVLPPFVDPVFQKNLFKQENRKHLPVAMPSGTINFTYIQRFDAKSGQLQLIEAFSLVAHKFPQARVVLVGGPSFTDSISSVRQKYFLEAKKYVKQLKLENKVIFLGGIDYDLLPIVYSQSDVICMLSKMECFGLAITEAFYYKLSVLVTAVGGLDYQVKDKENGFKVPVGDVQATAKALTVLAGSKATRETIGERAHEIYKREFSHEHLSLEYDSLYRSL